MKTEISNTSPPDSCATGASGSRIGIYLANGLIVLSLIAFGLALASQSPAAYRQAPPESFVLGKSPRLWGTTLLSATLCLLVIFGRVRRVEFLLKVGKPSGRVLLVLAITVVAYEAAGFTFARHLPITLLGNLPDWVKDVLPESAFERTAFRNLRSSEKLADQTLGWRLSPNQNIQLRYAGLEAKQVTDLNSFSNTDATLYSNSDIVTIGDSFTQGLLVDYELSWPQQLSDITGTRVLNLGVIGYGLYHYPIMLERWAIKANASAFVIGIFENDLDGDFYSYLDYVELHPEIKGYDEYMRAIVGSQTYQDWQHLDPLYPNYLSVVTRNMMVPISWVLPFSAATLEYMVQFSDRKPLGPVSFSLGGNQITMDYVSQPDFAASIPLYSNFYRFAKRRKFRSHAYRQYMDFQAIIDLARDHHIKLYLVYLPSAGEVYFPLLRDATNLNARAQMVASENNSTHIRPSEAYVSLLAMASLSRTPLYDATPYLQAKARAGEQLNLEFDPHPSPLGHLRIAEFVQSIMTDKGAKEALRNNRRP